LALAPAPVSAQLRVAEGLDLQVSPASPPGGGLDIGRENPVVPLPIYHSRPETGGFYTAIEFIMWRMGRNLAPEVIARRGFVDVDGSVQRDLGGTFIAPVGGGAPIFVAGAPGVPGTFIGSGTPALLASDVKNGKLTYEPGLKFTLGWRFDDSSAIEISGFHTATAKYFAGADIIPPGFAVGPILADTFLFAPVFNFPVEYAGPAQKAGLGNPGALYGIWNGANSMTIEFDQRYTQYDLTYRVPVRADDISRTNIIVAARFSWIWERFKWRTVSADFTGASGPSDVAIFTNIVSNRMYGPVLGCEHELYLGRGFAIAAEVDGTAFLDVVKERAQFERADRATESKHNITEYTFAPALNYKIHFTWYPWAGIQCRIGWNGLAILNTVNSPNPVSFNFGQINPDFPRKPIRYMDGLELGLAITF
jgi:hypothetical protein